MEAVREPGPLFFLEGCGDSDRMTWMLNQLMGADEMPVSTVKGLEAATGLGNPIPSGYGYALDDIASTSEHSVRTLQFRPERVGAAHASPGRFQDSPA